MRVLVEPVALQNERRLLARRAAAVVERCGVGVRAQVADRLPRRTWRQLHQRGMVSLLPDERHQRRRGRIEVGFEGFSEGHCLHHGVRDIEFGTRVVGEKEMSSERGAASEFLLAYTRVCDKVARIFRQAQARDF